MMGEVRAEKVELQTNRLVLRGAVPGDAEYLNEAFGDPEAMRYWYIYQYSLSRNIINST